MTVPATGAHRTGRHRYFFNGTGDWPSVTTVTGVLDKPALTRWQRETAIRQTLAHFDQLIEDVERGDTDAAVAYVMNLRNEGDTARERGSRVHAAVEASLKGEAYMADETDLPLIDGAVAWMRESNVRPIETEALLFNPSEGYAGTADLFAEIGGDVWLLDWKTSKSVADSKGRVWDEMRLQLAAYAHASFIARENDSTQYPVPQATKFGIVHVTADGSRLYPASVTDEDWEAFRACLRLYLWKGAKAA
jgi:hypothetical protein